MFDHITTLPSGSTTRRALVGLVATVAAAMGAPPANAELVASGTNPLTALFPAGGPFPVDILGALAGTTLTFNCTPTRPVMITYSAECSHDGTLLQWGTIQILLNGVVLPPTAGTNDAFCSGNETVGVHDGLATQSMEVVVRASPVRTSLRSPRRWLFAGTTLRLDDMSTVVDR